MMGTAAGGEVMAGEGQPRRPPLAMGRVLAQLSAEANSTMPKPRLRPASSSGCLHSQPSRTS